MAVFVPYAAAGEWDGDQALLHQQVSTRAIAVAAHARVQNDGECSSISDGIRSHGTANRDYHLDLLFLFHQQ